MVTRIGVLEKFSKTDKHSNLMYCHLNANKNIIFNVMICIWRTKMENKSITC